MTIQPKLRAFTLLAAIALLANVVAIGFTSRAMAYCSSCNTPAAVTYSAGYAAPVAYQAAYAPAPVAYQAAYAPAPVVYTTAYAPANTGWYPGRWLGRVNRSIWGVPTTTYYAPTYTAAYAPTYTAAYAPSYAAAYAPACSSCSAATVSYAPSYAPACSTCSACSASYAPACSACSTCDACAASSTPCASCAAGAVSQASYSEVVNVPAGSTYGTPSNTTLEPTPALPSDANIPSTREVEKPAPVDPLSLPEAGDDTTDDSATNLQAPKLFDPNDHTAQLHPAPVRTAVYQRVSGAESAAQTISWQQVERDAEGWSSAAE